MCVANRVDDVRARVGRAFQGNGDYGPSRTRRRGDVVRIQAVQCPLQGAKDFVSARVVRRQRMHELRQDLHVRLEPPHVVVADREISPAQVEQGGVGGSQPVTDLGGNESLCEDIGVRSSLHEEPDLLAAGCRRHDGHVSARWVNALERAP